MSSVEWGRVLAVAGVLAGAVGAWSGPVPPQRPLVAAGAGHSMVLDVEGRLWAWGWNAHGQLGVRDTADRHEPVEVTATGCDRWAAVAAYGRFTAGVCADDGSLWTWGYDFDGQLGDGEPRQDVWSPARISAGGDWNGVTAGLDHGIAVATNSLWSWGWNKNGQAGSSPDANQVIETPEKMVGVPEEGWVWLGAGRDHSLAVDTAGRLWGWGRKEYGQLGDGIGGATEPDRGDPREIPHPDGRKWAAATGGADHTLAIDEDGALWAWGRNHKGQLGVGDTADRGEPVRVGTVTGWVAVAAAGDFSVAIRTDGTLWAWGENRFGQLGLGNTENRLVPTQVGSDTDWAAVDAGQEDMPVEVPGGDPLEPGGHVIALKSDGRVFAWGRNTRGQLGDGTTEDRWSPVEVFRVAVSAPTGGGGGGGGGGCFLQAVAWGAGR